MSGVVVVGCGLGWGLVAAVPFLTASRRAAVVKRCPPSAAATARRAPRFRIGGPVGRVVRGILAQRRTRREAAALLAELPSVIDLLVVALGAGSTPREAVALAARWGPAGIGSLLHTVSLSTELGGSFADALRDLAVAVPLLAPVIDVLIASAQLGSPAAASLIRVGDATRQTLRRAAEAHARTVPIKLLFPLVFLVLPAFGLLTVVPAVLSALSQL